MTAAARPEQVSHLRPRVVDLDGQLGAYNAVGSSMPHASGLDRGPEQCRGRRSSRPARQAGDAAQRPSRRLTASVDHELARAGACGFVHLDTGRVCQLVHSHPESCQFRLRDVSVSGFIAADDRGRYASGSSQRWPSSDPIPSDLLQIEISMCMDADPPDTLVRLRGEVDILTAPGLRTALEECVAGNASNLLLDLEGLAFIDVRGLSVLVDVRRRLRLQHRELILRSPSPFTLRLIQAAGLSTVLGLDLCQLGAEDPTPTTSPGTSLPGLGCPCCRGEEFEVVAEIDLTAFRCLDCGCRWHVQLGVVRRFPGSTACKSSDRVRNGRPGRRPARDQVLFERCSSRDGASSVARGSGGL